MEQVEIFTIITAEGDEPPAAAVRTAAGQKIYASPFWALFELDMRKRNEQRGQGDGLKRFLYQAHISRPPDWREGSSRTSAALVPIDWSLVTPDDVIIHRIEYRLGL